MYITSSSILEQGDHIFKEKLTSGLSVVLSLSKKKEFLALGQQDGTNLFSFAFLTYISNISAWLNKSRRWSRLDRYTTVRVSLLL